MLIALVIVAAIAAIGSSLLSRPAAPNAATQPAAAPVKTAAPAPAAPAVTSETLVAQAELLLPRGKFDAAVALLENITGAESDRVGASELRDRIEQAHAEYDQGVLEARDAIAISDWVAAQAGILRAQAQAELPGDLLDAAPMVRREHAVASAVARIRREIRSGDLERARSDAQTGLERWNRSIFQRLIDQIDAPAPAAAQPKPAPTAVEKPVKQHHQHAPAADATAAAAAAAAAANPLTPPDELDDQAL